MPRQDKVTLSEKTIRRTVPVIRLGNAANSVLTKCLTLCEQKLERIQIEHYKQRVDGYSLKKGYRRKPIKGVPYLGREVSTIQLIRTLY